ncbi:MAG: sulfur carrier protein ThiS adenylyltransferase ThiF [Desulfovibrio sp.]|nr:sulfur carrier protein ThiS adenylyltransferase ThiF [Desulfovibrio sp.]
MPARFRNGLARYFTPEQLAALSSAKIGIAGAGGLGSNAAMLLARSGIENFIIVDHDHVEPSNLNRQHYWPDHLGLPKVEALAAQLLALNDQIRIEKLQQQLEPDSMAAIAGKANIWVEALDAPETKKMFVESALLAGAKVAAASGLAGFGGPPMRKRRSDNLIIVGDYVTSIEMAPPLAPRVTQAAALLADSVLEFILGPAPR